MPGFDVPRHVVSGSAATVITRVDECGNSVGNAHTSAAENGERLFECAKFGNGERGKDCIVHCVIQSVISE